MYFKDLCRFKLANDVFTEVPHCLSSPCSMYSNLSQSRARIDNVNSSFDFVVVFLWMEVLPITLSRLSMYSATTCLTAFLSMIRLCKLSLSRLLLIWSSLDFATTDCRATNSPLSISRISCLLGLLVAWIRSSTTDTFEPVLDHLLGSLSISSSIQRLIRSMS